MLDFHQGACWCWWIPRGCVYFERCFVARIPFNRNGSKRRSFSLLNNESIVVFFKLGLTLESGFEEIDVKIVVIVVVVVRLRVEGGRLLGDQHGEQQPEHHRVAFSQAQQPTTELGSPNGNNNNTSSQILTENNTHTHTNTHTHNHTHAHTHTSSLNHSYSVRGWYRQY